VLPTKDIASQVYDVFLSLAMESHIEVVLLAGDRSFAQEQKLIKGKPQIVVCTPGRLRDHLQTSISVEQLQNLRWLVIDEGDRLLSAQYHQWTTDLIPLLSHPIDFVDGPFAKPPLQKLVFSATMTSNPRKLATLKLYRPRFFHTVNEEKNGFQGAPVLPATLSEYKVSVSSEEERPMALVWLLAEGIAEKRQSLIFINSVERAHNLFDIISGLLKSQDLKIGLYTSIISARDRAKTLNDFKSGLVDAIIVTDVLARGLDVQGHLCVINYDCPFREETYVHRVGRTARAGNKGECYTLGIWSELARWTQMRARLQGGNVDETKVKPSKAFLEQHRAEFLAQLEHMKRKKARIDSFDKFSLQKKKKEMAIPLVPENLEAARAILASNKLL
jgi:ATP-dependent RNA helicase DDX51/DBP6